MGVVEKGDQVTKPDECIGCPLEKRGQGFSRPEGRGINGVLAVGEGLGGEEVLAGTPFVKFAPAGSCLEKAFELNHYDRQQFKLWNMVACKPPDTKDRKNALEYMPYEGDAIAHCKVYFDRVFNSVASRAIHIPCILALGNLPLRHLTGVSGSAKEKQSITHLRGYPLPSIQYPGTIVLGGLHPSFIRRGNMGLFPTLLHDVQTAVSIANGQWRDYKGGTDYKEPNYITNPSYQDALSFLHKVEDNCKLPLGIDIETDASKLEEDERESAAGVEIESVQFSLGDLNIYLPYTATYLPIIKKLLLAKNRLLGFNVWNFDGPILEAHGCKLGSLPHDLMWMFKHYQPGLRRNLQSVASFARFPFPWKHLYESERAYYACADVHALQVICKWLPNAMRELGVWRGYLDHIYGYYPILARGSKVGMPVDDTELDHIGTEYEARKNQRFRQLEELMPLDVRAVTPRRKNKDTGEVSYGYVRVPKPLKALVYKYRELKAKYEAVGRKVVDFRTYAAKCGYVARDGRWCKLTPLKTSSQQLVRYINWKREELLREHTESRQDKRSAPIGALPDNIHREIEHL